MVSGVGHLGRIIPPHTGAVAIPLPDPHMQTVRILLRSIILCASAFGALACGDDMPLKVAIGNGPMSARLNGIESWTASTGAAVHVAPGLYSITGIRTTAPNYTFVFQLANIGAAGTYPLGAGPQIFGGTATVSTPTLGSWYTPANGAAGEIVISTLTDTRIAGTFSFSAAPLSGAVSNLGVTSGVFDMPLTGTAAALPDNAGSKVTATINGVAFAAGSAASVLTTGASPTLTLNGNNLERTISISVANVPATGTYALSSATPVRTIQVTGAPGSATATWASQSTGGSGTVTITSITSTRITGGFNATLVPLGGGATGTLTVTGNFSMGRL